MNEETQPSKEGSRSTNAAPQTQTPEPLGTFPAQPATEKQLEKVEREMDAFERATLLWTRATFVILAVTCLFIAFQWSEMHSSSADTHALAVAAAKQADRMKDLADRMKDQAGATKTISDQAVIQATASKMLAQNGTETLKNTQRAFREEQRAWVGVEQVKGTGFTDKAPWTVVITFFNSGRTPARNVQSSAMFKTSGVPIAGPSPKDIKDLRFGPAQSIAPDGRYFQVLGTAPPGEPTFEFQMQGLHALMSSYQDIKNGSLLLYYFGILKYTDAFDIPRQTQFCIFLTNPETKEPAFCDSFNDLN